MNINKALSQARSLLCSRLYQLCNEHTRAVYIFKRVYEPELIPEHKRIQLHSLEERNFIYEVVKDTNDKPKPDMKVILTEYVEGIGDRGDVVEVPCRLARTILLPSRKAVYASPYNLADFEEERKKQEEAGIVRLSPWLKKTVRYLEEEPLTLRMNSEVDWVLNKKHIRVAYRLKGVSLDEDCITLPAEPIISAQDTTIGITINKFHNLEVKVRIEEAENSDDRKT